MADSWIKAEFHMVGMQTLLELRGEACYKLEIAGSPQKSIVSSRAFGRPGQTLAQLKHALAVYTARAVEKLLPRLGDSVCSSFYHH